MAQISDEEYEAEKKRVTRYHNILEIPDHFAYIGKELQKAHQALIDDKEYVLFNNPINQLIVHGAS